MYDQCFNFDSSSKRNSPSDDINRGIKFMNGMTSYRLFQLSFCQV